MQLFNEFNSRKLQTVERLQLTWHEWNVFEGVFSNPVFGMVVGTTFVLQIMIVCIGGYAFEVAMLDLNQWGWCILFGVLSLPFQSVINVILILTEPYFEEKVHVDENAQTITSDMHSAPDKTKST